MKLITIIAFSLGFLSCQSSLANAAPSKKELAELIERARLSWKVPGVAVVIVHNDEVIYLAGHGVKEIDRNDPVTAHTLFPMASCTKAFTTTLLAMLVEQGKLDWDDPVNKHVPFFRLSDPIADAQVTVRDLVTHRTGVAPHDLLWYRAPWSPKEGVRRLRHLPLSAPIRTKFQYQSTMFVAAGLAAESASGQSWAELLQERIFTPLKMKTAVSVTPVGENSKSLATGHRPNDLGRLEAVTSPYRLKEPDPAGSVYASAGDLTGWLRLHLNEGTVDGKRLVAQKHLVETHSAQMVLPLQGQSARLHPESNLLCYGMGWVLQDYRGLKILSHAGILDGFKVQVTIVPKAQLGFVILANAHATRMNLALGYQIIDAFSKTQKRRDWNRYLQTVIEDGKKNSRDALQARLAQRHLRTKPSRELAAYVGDYVHPAYGESSIRLERGRLQWRWNAFAFELEHFHFDTFAGYSAELGRIELKFSLSPEGGIERYSIGGPFEVDFRREKK